MACILGFVVDVPFCDMRTFHLSKPFEERLSNTFDTSLFLASVTMHFASGRDTNQPEFALLIWTGHFVASFICLWSIHTSLSSEAYLRN